MADWFSGDCRAIEGELWKRIGKHAINLITGKIVLVEDLLSSQKEK